MRDEHVNIRCFSLEINPIFEQTGQTIGLDAVIASNSCGTKIFFNG